MKVIWNSNSIKYRYSRNEQYYLKDYFVISTNKVINNTSLPILKTVTSIKVLDHEFLMIEGNFKVGDKLIADGIEYIYTNEENNTDVDNNDKPSIKDPSDDDSEIINFENNRILNIDNEIYIEKDVLDKNELIIEIKEYTNEIYPEYPFNIIKKKLILNKKKTLIHSIVKGTITVVTIKENDNLIELEYENTPLYHFSTVKSLKEKIQDLKLNIDLKSDDYYKKLISEKSILLKKSFGLTENEYKNIELFPIFKELVNLYCIKSIMSFGYINGSSVSDNSGSNNVDLTLGKFKSGGENNEGSIFSHDAIQSIIKINEQTLHNSIFNKSYKVERKKQSIDNYILPEFFLTKCKILRRKYGLQRKI